MLCRNIGFLGDLDAFLAADSFGSNYSTAKVNVGLKL